MRVHRGQGIGRQIRAAAAAAARKTHDYCWDLSYTLSIWVAFFSRQRRYCCWQGPAPPPHPQAPPNGIVLGAMYKAGVVQNPEATNPA